MKLTSFESPTNKLSVGNVDRQSLAWRYGTIEVRNASEWSLAKRFWPAWPSRSQAWIDARWRRLPLNCVRIYYNHSYRCPDFLVLAYAMAGRQTSIASLRKGLSILEMIAREKKLQAIVCEATNPKLSESVMGYFGYVRHAPRLKGHHYIKRLTSRPE